MIIALAATAFAIKDGNYVLLAAVLVPGAVIGALVASEGADDGDAAACRYFA
jgi:hypothetical protein